MSHTTEDIRPADRLFLLIADPLVNAFCVYLPLLLLTYSLLFFGYITDYAFGKCAFFLYTATYLNKDIAGGRSIGKRLLGYAVVNENNRKPPRKAICFLRNITFLIYIAELIYGLFSPKKKITDSFTHTMIIRANKESNPISSFYNELKTIPYNDETREVLGLTILLFLFVLILQ